MEIESFLADRSAGKNKGTEWTVEGGPHDILADGGTVLSVNVTEA